MADKTDDAANANKGSYQDQIRDAVQNAGNAAEDDLNDDDQDDAANNAGAAEGDDHSNDDDGDDAGNDDQGDDAEGDDSGDGAGDDDEDKGKSDVKLSQFKGDGKRGSYTKNLEQGYLDLAQENNTNSDRAEAAERQVAAIKAAAAKDPKFGEQLLKLLDVNGSGASGGDAGDGGSSAGASDSSDDENPFLIDARTKWMGENEKSTKEFVDANPEVVTDPKLNKQVKRLMKVFSDDALKNEGRLMQAGEAMEKAYGYLGLTDKRKANQSLVEGMKGGAAPTRPQRPKKAAKANTKQFSNLTLNLASKMGISKDRLVKGTQKS